MNSLLETLLVSYTSSFLSIILFHPWRALVTLPGSLPSPWNRDTWNHTKKFYALTPTFYTDRWKGMVRHVEQPALIAIGPAMLYGLVILASSYTSKQRSLVFPCLLTGAFAHASCNTVLYLLAQRMRDTDHRGRFRYPTLWLCLQQSTHSMGFWAWIPGSTLLMISHLWTYALPLLFLLKNEKESLKRQARGGRKVVQKQTISPVSSLGSFMAHWFHGLVLSALGVTLATPFRVIHQSVVRGSREVSLNSPRQWLRYEYANWWEGLRVLSTCRSRDGLLNYLLQPQKISSLPRTIGKVSVPFGFSWALYRAFEGPVR